MEIIIVDEPESYQVFGVIEHGIHEDTGKTSITEEFEETIAKVTFEAMTKKK